MGRLRLCLQPRSPLGLERRLLVVGLPHVLHPHRLQLHLDLLSKRRVDARQRLEGRVELAHTVARPVQLAQ